jgi:hypothetical protein
MTRSTLPVAAESQQWCQSYFTVLFAKNNLFYLFMAFGYEIRCPESDKPCGRFEFKSKIVRLNLFEEEWPEEALVHTSCLLSHKHQLYLISALEALNSLFRYASLLLSIFISFARPKETKQRKGRHENSHSYPRCRTLRTFPERPHFSWTSAALETSGGSRVKPHVSQNRLIPHLSMTENRETKGFMTHFAVFGIKVGFEL